MKGYVPPPHLREPVRLRWPTRAELRDAGACVLVVLLYVIVLFRGG